MRVLFLAPNFPAEMPHFSQGLAEVGATVVFRGSDNDGRMVLLVLKAARASDDQSDDGAARVLTLVLYGEPGKSGYLQGPRGAVLGPSSSRRPGCA